SNSGVDKGFYTVGEDNAADSAVVKAALPWLKEDYQLILIHLDQVDFAGHHEGGPENPNWTAAAIRSDDLLRDIVSNLDLTQDTVMVISDHGQIDPGGHGGPDPITLIEPFVLAGKGVIPGVYGNVNMTDIAPTLAALLGTSIPGTNQGHVLISMLSLPSERIVSIQNALIIQQTQLLKVYTKAISSSINIGDGEIVSAAETGIKQAIQTRLSGERIWRNMLAVFLAILPGYLLFVRKDKKVLWLVAGAILYIVLFNLRYAIIDGRTYSLSSIKGANWLIVYIGITTVVAVIIGWLVPVFGLRAFVGEPHKSIKITLGYIWLIIYLLALPILLSFAVNGLSVTWTLPEWYTMFIGLISLVQWLFVGLAGLLLTGLLAILSQLNRKRA
ncbi:MAG: alkaline phosphatase family protein, partial [Anaerolineales bacterium]